MKVITVYNRYVNRGGEDEVFESEIDLLRRHGCDVYPVEEQTRPPHTLISKISAAGTCVWSESWRRKFRRILADQKPDVVHVQNCFPVISPSIYFACHEALVPVVQTLHNYRLICPSANLYRDGHVCEDCMQDGLWRGVQHGCYQGSHMATAAVGLMVATHRYLGTWSKMVDLYITHTEFGRQTFIRGGLPAHKIRVKPNFVEPDPGLKPTAGDYALFVGRLSEQKGVLTLIQAWKSLRLRVPLVIVGDGPLRDLVKSELPKGTFPNVNYRGRLSRAETIAAMKSARFLVFPSEWYEGFPMTIVEAFACGLPVVCGRLGAMNELVKERSTGLHFEPGDATDLARQVEWVWQHHDEVQIMSAAARDEYKSRLTGEQNYKLLIDLYESAVRAGVSAQPTEANASPVFQ